MQKSRIDKFFHIFQNNLRVQFNGANLPESNLIFFSVFVFTSVFGYKEPPSLERSGEKKVTNCFLSSEPNPNTKMFSNSNPDTCEEKNYFFDIDKLKSE